MFSTREIHMARNWRAEGWGSSGSSAPWLPAQAGTDPRETAKAAVETAAPEDRRMKERRSTVLTRRGLLDRKSTRLNSSHVAISYAVYCLKTKIIAYQEDV